MSKLAGRRRPPVQALLAAGLLLLLISLGGAAGTVQAGTMCSYAGTRAVMDSLPAQMARSDLVFVGTVTAERPAAKTGTRQFYESTLHAEAWLRGEPPPEPITIPWLGGIRGDCKGGPSFREGERVVIGLSWTYFGTSGGGESEYAWQLTSPFVGKLLLQDGQVVSEGEFERFEAVGETASVIRMIGEAVGASDPEIEAAISAARAPGQVSPAERSDLPWSTIAIIATVLVAMVLVVALRRRQRAHDAPR